MSKPSHTLLLIRHAHRDIKHPRLDNGLSAKGRRQVNRIFKLYKAVFGKRPRPVLLTSPKRRCLETIDPLARWTGAVLQKDDRLLEHRPFENLGHFEARVGEVLRELKESPAPLTVVCSHGDWIPAALRTATGGRMRLKKGGWAQIEFEEGEGPRLSWLLQKLD